MNPPTQIMSEYFIFSQSKQVYIEKTAPRPRIAKRPPKIVKNPLDNLESFVWCADDASGVHSWVRRCNKCDKPAWMCAKVCH